MGYYFIFQWSEVSLALSCASKLEVKIIKIELLTIMSDWHIVCLSAHLCCVYLQSLWLAQAK